MLNLLHYFVRAHWPEWYGVGGMRACLRCTSGGRRIKWWELRGLPIPG